MNNIYDYPPIPVLKQRQFLKYKKRNGGNSNNHVNNNHVPFTIQNTNHPNKQPKFTPIPKLSRLPTIPSSQTLDVMNQIVQDQLNMVKILSNTWKVIDELKQQVHWVGCSILVDTPVPFYESMDMSKDPLGYFEPKQRLVIFYPPIYHEATWMISARWFYSKTITRVYIPLFTPYNQLVIGDIGYT